MTSARLKKTNLARALCLSLFMAIVALHTQNTSNMVYGQTDSLPNSSSSGVGDIMALDPLQNQDQSYTSNNATNISENVDAPNSENTNCDMPPCPPGHACIQSCP